MDFGSFPTVTGVEAVVAEDGRVVECGRPADFRSHWTCVCNAAVGVLGNCARPNIGNCAWVDYPVLRGM